MMLDDIEKVVVSVEDLARMNKELGAKITKDYEGKSPLFIGLLRGCLPFLADLMRNVNGFCRVDYLRVSSYSGTESTGSIRVYGAFPEVEGQDVILVDDICDTGRTLNALTKLLKEHGAASVKTCVLLDKPEGRKEACSPDYVGGIVPKEFVVGYGLDYNENYRNLPFIGVLKEKVYRK